MRYNLFKVKLQLEYPCEVDVIQTDCQYMSNCQCYELSESESCGQSASQVKDAIVKYYEHKAEYLRNLTITEFLHDYGFYYDTEGDVYGADDSSSLNKQREVCTKNITVSKRRIFPESKL